jgi:hypothetical protein
MGTVVGLRMERRLGDQLHHHVVFSPNRDEERCAVSRGAVCSEAQTRALKMNAQAGCGRPVGGGRSARNHSGVAALRGKVHLDAWDGVGHNDNWGLDCLRRCHIRRSASVLRSMTPFPMTRRSAPLMAVGSISMKRSIVDAVGMASGAREDGAATRPLHDKFDPTNNTGRMPSARGNAKPTRWIPD